MYYTAEHYNSRKPKQYKSISLFVVIYFIIYTSHNLKLLSIFKDQIDPSVLIAFINYFHRFVLNKHAVEEIKRYIWDGSNAYELVSLKKGNAMPQIKVINQELVVMQKGFYKKVISNNRQTRQIRKAEYLFLRKIYKIKKNAKGDIVKADEKISVKAMSSIEFSLPF